MLGLSGLPQLHLRVTPIALDLAVYRSVRDVNDPAALTAPFHNTNGHVRVFPSRGRRSRWHPQRITASRSVAFSNVPRLAERNAPAVRELARSYPVDMRLVHPV